MKYERLKKDNHTKIAIGVIIICTIILIATFLTSHANYQISSDGIIIVNNEVNYTPYDLKILNVYQQKDDCLDISSDTCYSEIEAIPVSLNEYVLNEEKSYCFVDNEDEHITNITINTNENGEHTLSSLPKRSKCRLWFKKADI